MAFFAGAGTVIAAISIGLGGGLTAANIMSPHQNRLEQTKLEQRMSAKPIPPSAEADQPKQQAEQTKPAATDANTPLAPDKQQPQTQAATPAPQPSPQPAEAKTTNKLAHESVKPAEPPTAKPQATPREQASSSTEDKNTKTSSSDDKNAKALSPEDANAKARDSDLKRLAAEKRKAQRRQQWADRKAKAQQQRDADANARGEGDGPNFGGNDGPRIRDSRDRGSRLVVRQDDNDFDRRGDFDRRRDFDRRGPDRPFGFPGFNLFGGGDRDD
jgi:hypothetical protein